MLRRLIEGLALSVFAAAALAGAAPGALRVVGGSTIQVQAAPWTVFVAYVSGATEYDCTGSIVDATHILTAAHCLYDSAGTLAQPSQVSVTAGVSNFLAPSSTDLPQDRAVSSVRVHPGFVYTGTEAPDDVAVLGLSSQLDLSGPAAQAIALPSPNAPFPAGAAVAIAGFGLQNSSDALASGPLQSMTATVDPQGECGQSPGNGLIDFDAIVFCAASTTGSLCHGDSGSGLVTTAGAPVLVGVADAAAPGCPAGSHNVFAYTGAPEILQFIQGNDQPPTAPRRTGSSPSDRVTWLRPLVVGDTLTCSTGGWPASVQTAYSFLEGTSGAVLQSGAHPRYVVAPAALGAAVSCAVSVTNSGGTTLVEAGSTPPVKAPPQLTIVPLAPLSANAGRSLTLQVVLRSPPGLSGRFKVCVQLPAAVGGHLCHSVQEQFGAYGSFPFRFALRVKPTAPHGDARVVVSASAGLSSAQASELVRIAA